MGEGYVCMYVCELVHAYLTCWFSVWVMSTEIRLKPVFFSLFFVSQELLCSFDFLRHIAALIRFHHTHKNMFLWLFWEVIWWFKNMNLIFIFFDGSFLSYYFSYWKYWEKGSCGEGL